MKVLLLLCLSGAAAAQEASPAPDGDRLHALEQRVAELEAAQKKAVEREKVTPLISFGPTGMVLKTPDGQTAIQTRGLVQADGRAFLGDSSHSLSDTFLLRRVRPSIDATFFGWLNARLMPDFGQNKAIVSEAYVDLVPWKWLSLIAGKFKPPVGLERLQAEAAIKFIERGFPTNLVPSRDVGAMLHGKIFEGTIEYQLGVFNGVVDGAETPDVDLHDGKEVDARLFFHPLRFLHKAWLDNLAFGLAGSYGNERGAAQGPNVATYKTPGQNTFFSYYSDITKPDGFTFANGTHWRASPQLYYYGGPAGILAEYVRSSEQVQKGATRGTSWSQAWQVQLSVLLTPGDRNAFDNVVIKRPLEYHNHGYGAFELVARYHEQHINLGTFPVFADPAKSARQARSFGVGLNWYANRFFRAAINFDRTDFVGGAAKGNRAPENALMGRLQVVF